MSTIARKLCHDIVEPILKPSSTDSRKLSSSEKSVNTISNIKKNVNPRQHPQLEKKKYVKIEPSHITNSSANKVKFSDKGIKKSINSEINTPYLRPMSCDNDCITLIHKRDHQLSCKFHNFNTNIKGISKEIQTLSKSNYSISDKSCTHCVETVSCGTQHMDNINGIIKYSRSKPKVAMKIQDSTETYKLRRKHMKQTLPNEDNYKFNLKKLHVLKSPSLRYVGAKRWALSNYPTRGPDF